MANEAVLRVNDTAVTDRASLDRALGTAPSSELRFGLEPGANGDERELVVVRLRWLTQRVVFFSGLGFAALGFTALWLQPGTRSSWGFVVFCAHFALFALFRSIPFLYRSGIERHIFLLLQCFLPASTYLFLATFTPLRLLLRRSTPTFGVAIAFGAALIGLNWCSRQRRRRRGS